MLRIAVHCLDDAPEATRETLRELHLRLGVFNVHGEMKHARVVRAVDAGVQRAVVAIGSFDARTRDPSARIMGVVDNCSYCQFAPTLAGTKVLKKYHLATAHTAAPKRTRLSAPTAGVLVDTYTSIKPGAVHRHSKAVTSDLHAITSRKADFIAPTNNVGS